MSGNFDVIVVGLGAMGSAAIYQLAKRGARVLGIDQFAPPHQFGSTHGDTRVTRQAVGEGPAFVPLVLRSYELWREIEQATGKDLLTITGGLILAGADSRSVPPYRPDFFRRTIQVAEAHGIPHEQLNPAAIAQRFPQFHLAGQEAGYYEPGAGFLRPERCVEAQLRLAEHYGAQIHRNERVLGYGADTAGRSVTVHTDAGSYVAQTLVLAAGPWIGNLLEQEYAAPFRVYRQVMYWFAVRGSIEPFLPGNFPVFIWHFGDGSGEYIYGFPAIDGPDGSVKVATAQFHTTTTPDSVDRDVPDEEIRRMYDSHVAGYLPGLASRCLKSRVCLYTVTADEGFVIDRHPRHANVLVASPCSGHGFKHSAAIGEVLAQLALDGQSKIDVSAFSFARLLGRTPSRRQPR